MQGRKHFINLRDGHRWGDETASDWHVILRALPTGRRPAGADPAGQGPGIAPEPWIIAEPSPGVCRRENSSATGTEAF
ncbi:unnamed protein product [Boreogadus saida]